MTKGLTPLEEEFLRISVAAESALTDYVETIERKNPMTALNFGHSVIRGLREVIAKAERRK